MMVIKLTIKASSEDSVIAVLRLNVYPSILLRSDKAVSCICISTDNEPLSTYLSLKCIYY